MRSYEPGIDQDFSFEFEGTVAELMSRIDDEEDTLIENDREEWETIAGIFNVA